MLTIFKNFKINKMGHKGHYGEYSGNAKWSRDHAHTKVTKENYKASERDDAAHVDYLERDVKDDQRTGGKYKDENQTADEKHISKLAGDIKHDKKKEGLSRNSSSPLNISIVGTTTILYFPDALASF